MNESNGQPKRGRKVDVERTLRSDNRGGNHQLPDYEDVDRIMPIRALERSEDALNHISHHTASSVTWGDVELFDSYEQPPEEPLPSTDGNYPHDKSSNSLPFGRLRDLSKRPTEFRRPNCSDDLDCLSDVEDVSVSLHDEESGVTPKAHDSRNMSVNSFASSWDSVCLRRPDLKNGETKTPRMSKPSELSSSHSLGIKLSSFRSRKLTRHLSHDPNANFDHLRADEIIPDATSSEGPSTDFGTEENIATTTANDAPAMTETTPSSISRFCTFFDDWLRRKIQWLYVFVAMYVAPVCIAYFSPPHVVNALFFTSIACVTFVNAWMLLEVLCSFLYTRRMRRIHHVLKPEIKGQRHLGSIVAAYLPNELSVLVDTVKAVSATIHELPEGTTMDIVLAHNGGKKEQRISFLEDLCKVEMELPKNVMVHELNIMSSRSKAENVNAALGFLDELSRFRNQEITQVAMYDADHQPIPQAWRYALETMEVQNADMVMGRCCVQDGLKYIAVEFDILYAVAHAGGRAVRGFGFFGGSNGYWDFKTLLETGMDEGMLTEDVDSSFRAQAAGHRMTYDPTIVSYEESPPDFSGLFKQRLRWSQGWYEVTLRQITLPFRKAPGLTLWSRFCIFLILPFREIYVYASSFTVPIAIVHLVGCGWGCVDYRLLAFAGYCLVVPIAMTIAAWNITKDRYADVHYRMQSLRPIDYFRYIFISYFYEFFKIHVTVMGHARHMLGLNKWVVTKRKTTNVQPAPAMSRSMVERTVPELLVRLSPFARSTRQLFTGTYDENRPQKVEHCYIEEEKKRKEARENATPKQASRRNLLAGTILEFRRKFSRRSPSTDIRKESGLEVASGGEDHWIVSPHNSTMEPCSEDGENLESSMYLSARTSATSGEASDSSPIEKESGGRRSVTKLIMEKMRQLQQRNEDLQTKLKEKSTTMKTTSLDASQEHAAALQEVSKWEALYFETAELGARSLERLEAQVRHLQIENERLKEERNQAKSKLAAHV